MPVPKTHVGQSVPRTDAWEKVTGRARYVADLTRPEMLHGATVRSTIPRGRIVEISFDDDFDWQGITVVDHRDIPGKNEVALIEFDQPILVERDVRHLHEPILLLAAEDPCRAREAAAAVRVRYEPRPIVTDVEDSLAAEIRIHGQDNVFKRINIERGDVATALAGATHVVEESFQIGSQEHLYIEPQGMLAEPLEDGGVRVIGSLQCPWYVHRALMHALGIADSRQVEVAQCETGGGFGGKEEYPSMIAVHAALLARASGRPVRLVYSRHEDMAATPKRHPAEIHVRAGVDAAGRLVAYEADIVLDGGAYVTLSPVVLSRAVLHATSAYRCDAVAVRGRVVATNLPPYGAFRGFGAPQAIFACERTMDLLAAAAGLSPAEIRRLNLLRTGDETTTGQRLDDVSAAAVLDRVLIASEYESRRRDHAERRTAADGRLRGIGLSVWMHGCGFTGSGEDRLASRVSVQMRRDPAAPSALAFDVFCAAAEMGQGARTTLRQIAADAFGVAIQSVHLVAADTALVPDSGPTVASRTCMVVGGLIHEAAQRLLRELGCTDVGPAALQAALDARHGDAVTAEAHWRPDAAMSFDEEHYRGAAYRAWGYAAVVVEVAVDPDTGEVETLDVATCQDPGVAIHPWIVEGQIEGGTAQALGWASMEAVHLVDGGMANLRLCDYPIPTSADLPHLRVLLHESSHRGSAFGAKGIGEMPMDGPAAAWVSAVSAAVGRAFTRLPLLPERIIEGMARS